MTYSENLQIESKKTQFLVVMTPKKRVIGWSAYGTFVYVAPFATGFVTAVNLKSTIGPIIATKLSSIPLSSDIFGYFYDDENKLLYINNGGDLDPTTSDAFIVAAYELYIATTDVNWHRDPLDPASRVVPFEPYILKAPQLLSSSSDVLFGVLPVHSTSLVATNTENFFNEILFDQSFRNAEFRMYHWVGKISSLNIQLVFRGIGNNVVFEDDQVTFNLYDQLDALNGEFRNQNLYPGTFNNPPIQFYDAGIGSGPDPAAFGRPIRQVLGRVDGFIPTRFFFSPSGLGPNPNRWFCVAWGIASSPTTGGVLRNPDMSQTNTNTVTFFTDISGFNVGDTIWLLRLGGGSTQAYAVITAVDPINLFIEHLGGWSDGNPVNHFANIIERSFVGNVTVVQDNISYQLKFVRDYFEYTPSLSGGMPGKGFRFTSNMEANVGMPRAFSATDQIFCRAYGRQNEETIAGVPFGSDQNSLGNMSNGCVIIYALLKQAGIPEDEIDIPTFQTLASDIGDPIGIAIPENQADAFPTYREIIEKICQTLLLKIYVNSEAKWTIAQVKPLTAANQNIDDVEIGEGSLQYEFDYTEMASDILVQYNKREVPIDINRPEATFDIATAISDAALYLHGVSRQKSFDSLHVFASDAQTLAQRLSFIFGERRGTLKFSSPIRFFSSLLSDIFEVSRTRLPGFPFNAEELRVRNFSVNETNKDLRVVGLILDDQKGIEDNAEGW
ncbi:MAG: hypothetical protein SGI74_12895 [Oligoflexia bacterium]|nr:hypothetical protein [Oligoflexia bacterium]